MSKIQYQTCHPIKNLPRYNPEDINRWYYTVVWCGNYKFDHYREGDGSHPGVDIDATKYPSGHTPVYAVMNGQVVLTKKQATGYGLHIVIEHPYVPDPSDSSKKTTLRSDYCHLSEINVQLGQQVRCGQQIGVTGNSGSSTGSHLHFQIDRVEAPFSPYWPFSIQERQKAGFSSFWRAVDKAFGIDNVRKYCINPLPYLQKFMPECFYFPDVHKQNSYNIAVHYWKKKEIIQGYSDGLFHPDWPVRRDEFLKIIWQALDQELTDQDKNEESPFTDINSNHWAHPYINAAFHSKAIRGYYDGTFRPGRFISRAEAFKIIFEVTNVKLPVINKSPFIDIWDEKIWYALYAALAKQKKLLDFDNKCFQAEKPMTRAEACLVLWRLSGEPRL